MRDLKLSQEFTIIALNAQDSSSMTIAKKAALRCVASSVVLDYYLDGKFTLEGNELSLNKGALDNADITLYEESILKALFNKNDILKGNLNWWMKTASNLSTKHLKELEHTITDYLKGNYLLDEIPTLLGCDMYYKTAGISTKEYCGNIDVYSNITEKIRSVILNNVDVSDKVICIIWLLRESGCLTDIFSKKELETISINIHELSNINSLAKSLFEIQIYHGAELAIKGFFNMKKTAINTPTGTGINFTFPIIERSQSIFIDTEEWFANPTERLNEVKARLDENGHKYTVIRAGKVPIIKIDNIMYELIPDAVTNRIPIHGVRLRRYTI